MEITEIIKCTGCKMCADVCSQHAISFQIDVEGFWYPIIDSDLCIGCGKCKKKCPQNNCYISKNNEPKVYSAWNRDDKIRLQSTSGGIFFAFAKEIIKEGGYVVGCQYSKDYKSAFHSIAKNEEDLYKLVGSKYFQSDTENIYVRVMRYLEKGRIILFCGTPCQIDALYAFLDREYTNLITLDFICLGINSPKAFYRFISEQENIHESKVKFVQLKNKKEGWESLATYIEFENGETYFGNKDNDLWIKGFIKERLFMRPSCYQCKYRKIPRIADITVGDFWGNRYMGKQNQFKGISAILINSKKGGVLLEKINSKLYCKKSCYELLRPGNIALEKDMKWTDSRENFFGLLGKYPFSKAVKKSCQGKLAKQTYTVWEKVFESIIDIEFDKKIKIIKRFSKENGIAYIQKHFLDIDVFKFIYYNYITSNIIREDGIYFVPYKNAVIDIAENARIYIYNKSIKVGTNKLKNSKSETHIRLYKNAVWISRGGAEVSYNTILEVGRNAVFESEYFTTNRGSAIICMKHIIFGENVMLARNVIVYDSDHHRILDSSGRVKNYSKKIQIDNNVWLATNSIILKGVHIGAGSVIGAGAIISKDVLRNNMVVTNNECRILDSNINWDRKMVY